MNLQEIRAEIVALSGSGKRVATTRRHGIYSTFTLPGLEDMPGVRDTRRRFDDFHVDQDLTGRTVIDVGSNVGAMAFEFARRGAVVTGLEYRSDRVALCAVIAAHYADHPTMPRARFHVADFNRPWKLEELGKHDIVLCSSVDEYIDDRPSFYSMLREICAGTLLFESNVQRGQDELDTISALRDAGFREIRYLGNGHSGGISRKRKLFTATTEKE